MAHGDIAGPQDAFDSSSTRPKSWAWWICWLMFAVTVLNYMDRQALAIVGPKIKVEFRLTDTDFGWVLAAFSMSYAFFQVPAGYLVDRWNLRWVYAGAVTWWSLAAIAATFSPTLGVLMALRAVLVLVWLTALGGKNRRVLEGVAANDDRGEHATGISSRASGAFIALALSSVALALMSMRIGLTAIWLAIAWFMGGLLIVARSLPEHALEGADWTRTIGEVVRVRRFWIMMAVSVSINVCWHFLLNWLPTIIKEDLSPPDWLQAIANPVAALLSNLFGGKVKQTDVGMTLLITLPYLAADLGNLLGGASSRFLAGRGLSPVKARMIVMGVSTVVISSGAFVGKTGNSYLAIYLLSFMALGTAAFMANYFSFAQEASTCHTGLVVGILGAFGNLFAAGFMPFAGKVKEATGGFAPIFVLVGLMPFVGLATLYLGWGEEPEDGTRSA